MTFQKLMVIINFTVNFLFSFSFLFFFFLSISFSGASFPIEALMPMCIGTRMEVGRCVGMQLGRTPMANRRVFSRIEMVFGTAGELRLLRVQFHAPPVTCRSLPRPAMPWVSRELCESF